MVCNYSSGQVLVDTVVGAASGFFGAKVTAGADKFTEAMRPVNAYMIKTGLETGSDTLIDVATGRPVTPETVFQNLSMNLIGNGIQLLPLGNNKPPVNAPLFDGQMIKECWGELEF